MTRAYKLIIASLALLCAYLLLRPSPCLLNDEGDRMSHHPVSKYKVLHTSQDLNLYIYSALLDDRFNRSILRTFALEQKDNVDVELSCRWSKYDESMGMQMYHEIPAKKFFIDTSWPNWSPYFACEYSCPVPRDFKESVIELVSEGGKHQFIVNVEYTKQKAEKKNIAVCVKPLTGYLRSTSKLVEWFEMLRLVGIENIITYTTDITGSARFVFQYYEEQKIATVVPFPYLLSVMLRIEKVHPNLSGEDRYAIYQQTYLIAMHDCLYRFRGMYKYLLFIDIDEIIVPSSPDEDINSVLTRADKLYPSAAGYLFLTAWHWEEAGKQTVKSPLYMQSYPKATKPLDNQPKSAISTSRVITMNFHEVLDVPNTELTSEILPWKDFAYIHHFRGKCSNKFPEDVCKRMLADSDYDGTIPSYKKDVEKNVEQILEMLQMP